MSWTPGGHMLSFDKESSDVILQQCSEHLNGGQLVAFPTETVYGLGANALNEQAVLSIFEAKQRPLTDPVIVHVLDVTAALELIDINEPLTTLYLHLAKNFWPGPLTIVANSNKKIVPDCVTAGTGAVGVRVPNHDIARELLRACKLPIAAPSANRFGHVSPTTGQHVMEDLGKTPFPILIIDTNEACDVGIESTVIKLEQKDENEMHIHVLRRGGISVEQISKSLSTNNESLRGLLIQLIVAPKTRSVSNDTTKGQVSPGLMLTHYAPDVPAFIMDEQIDQNPQDITSIALEQCVLIDFGGKHAELTSHVLKYFDLSAKGDVQEARTTVFDKLRASEKVQNAKAVILPNLQHVELEHADSLFDRLYRAASGRFARVTQSHLLCSGISDQH
jgi:L-threonylcarbamoyladenylate synthase